MVLLAALAGLAVVFVAKFLPETKGVSLEEITTIFEQQADKGRGKAREEVARNDYGKMTRSG